MKKKPSSDLPRLKAVYNNGKSIIKAISKKKTKEFKVVMYTDKDFKKINAAKEKLSNKEFDPTLL